SATIRSSTSRARSSTAAPTASIAVTQASATTITISGIAAPSRPRGGRRRPDGAPDRGPARPSDRSFGSASRDHPPLASLVDVVVAGADRLRVARVERVDDEDAALLVDVEHQLAGRDRRDERPRRDALLGDPLQLDLDDPVVLHLAQAERVSRHLPRAARDLD